jgi:DNA-binding CsgD family transcriptional regulator
LTREIDPQYLSQLISACGEKSASRCEVEANRPDVLSTVPPAERLSARESKILTMILEGKNVKEIAVGLMISANTAKAHIRSIHRKMGVHSRQGVIQRAKELGLGG